MIQLPELLSQVFWQGALYRVRDRIRNKTTGIITLHLCHCNDATCTHPKQAALLDEIKPVPSPGEMVCHYQDRIPHTVIDAQVRDGRCYLALQPKQGQPFLAPLTITDYYPGVGDEVYVVAGFYAEWIEGEADAVRGRGKHPSRRYTELIESLEDLWWTGEPCTLRMIEPDGMALIAGDGQRRKVPLKCLKVCQKR